ncbi:MULTISPECIES: class III lanthipeptide [Paenibacillus]|nr:class III lanthipeptide [Paenibacillus amylolyticus]
MNEVLELQKLAHNTDDKGQEVEAAFTWPISTITTGQLSTVCIINN